MVEFTPQQMQVIERLFGAGFRPIAIPLYERSLCITKGECVAVLAPVEGDGLQIVGSATFLIDGNIGVRLRRDAKEVFTWKKKEIAATRERLEELSRFQSELNEILNSAIIQ